eukprot:1160384-Pelagomonas_calceolata.AAC.1
MLCSLELPTCMQAYRGQITVMFLGAAHMLAGPQRTVECYVPTSCLAVGVRVSVKMLSASRAVCFL